MSRRQDRHTRLQYAVVFTVIKSIIAHFHFLKTQVANENEV